MKRVKAGRVVVPNGFTREVFLSPVSGEVSVAIGNDFWGIATSPSAALELAQAWLQKGAESILWCLRRRPARSCGS